MKVLRKKYPTDIILCILWSAVRIPISLLNVEGIIRVLLGLPFLLFIPGYLLILVVFPTKKTDTGIDTLERIALSFGLSIAIVPLIGLGLNFTQWGIRLEPILISIFIFIISIGALAIYQWKKTNPNERFTISLEASFLKKEIKINKVITIILTLSIIIAAISFVYVIISPNQGEKFTEFYILSSEGNASGYPENLIVGEDATVKIGILNHEYQTINYTIEVWLIKQKMVYNELIQNNDTIINNSWFIEKITVTLKHIPVDMERNWKTQWEYNYKFNISKRGESMKLAFLLFTTPTESYNFEYDYKDIMEEKINNAYRKTHLFINVI